MFIKKSSLFFIFLIFNLFIISFIFLEINKEFVKIGYALKDSVNSFVIGDGNYYYSIYNDNMSLYDIFSMIFINKNLIPPLLQLKFFDGNILLISYVNFIFLFFSSLVLLPYLRVNKYIFYILVLFNPFILTNLFSFGKEIPAYISILFYLSYLLSKKKRYFILSIFVALFVRFELFILLLIFPLACKLSFRKSILFLFLIFLSIVYVFIGDTGEFNLINNPNF